MSTPSGWQPPPSLISAPLDHQAQWQPPAFTRSRIFFAAISTTLSILLAWYSLRFHLLIHPRPHQRRHPPPPPLHRRTSLSCTDSWRLSPRSFPRVLTRQRLHPQTQSPLFANLPAELRAHIFALALGGQRFHVENRPRRRGVSATACLGAAALPCLPVAPASYRSSMHALTHQPVDWAAMQARILRGHVGSKELRDHRFCCLPWHQRGAHAPGLLRACRRGYVEGVELLYKCNVFAFDSVDNMPFWCGSVLQKRLWVIREVEFYMVFGGSLGRYRDKLGRVLGEMGGLRVFRIVPRLDSGREVREGLEEFARGLEGDVNRGRDGKVRVEVLGLPLPEEVEVQEEEEVPVEVDMHEELGAGADGEDEDEDLVVLEMVEMEQNVMW